MRRLLAFVGLFWGLLVAQVGYWLARRRLDRKTRTIERLLASRPVEQLTRTEVWTDAEIAEYLDPTNELRREQFQRMLTDMLQVEAEPGDEEAIAAGGQTLYDRWLASVVDDRSLDFGRIEKASAQLDAHESCDPDCGDCPELGCSHHTEIVLR